MAKLPARKRLSQDDLNKKVYGARPDYSENASILEADPKTRKFELVKGLNYHANYFDARTSSLIVQKWLKNQTYFEIDSKQIAFIASNFQNFCPTFYSLMQMEADGWILSETEVNQMKHHLFNELGAKDLKVNKKSGGSTSSSNTQNESKKVSPRKKMENQLDSSILGEIEGRFDTWLFGSTKEKKEVGSSIDLKSLFAEHELTPSNPALGYVQSLAKSRSKEYKTALDAIISKESTDEDVIQLKEGYSTFTRIQLRKMIQLLDSFIDSIELMKTKKPTKVAAKTTPRKNSKHINLERILKNVKYQKESNEYGVKSLDPAEIFGATGCVLFNTKYKRLYVFYSIVGESLAIKGSTIQNTDEARSYVQGVRKPESDLVTIVQAKNLKQINNATDNYTTKRTLNPPSRLNDNTVILKIFK